MASGRPPAFAPTGADSPSSSVIAVLILLVGSAWRLSLGGYRIRRMPEVARGRQMGSGPDTETLAPVVKSGMTRRRGHVDQARFIFIEVLVAASVLRVGVLSALALFDLVNARTVVDRQREAATSLARDHRGRPQRPVRRLGQYGEPRCRAATYAGTRERLRRWRPYTVMRRGTRSQSSHPSYTGDDVKDGGGSRASSMREPRG
jgi:hypothetical protein